MNRTTLLATAKIGLRVFVPVLAAALAVSVASVSMEALVQRLWRQGLAFLPLFDLRESLGFSGRWIILGTLPIALGWLAVPYIQGRWSRGLLIAVGAVASALLTVPRFGHSFLDWLGAATVATVLAAIMAEWRPVPRVRKRCLVPAVIVATLIGLVFLATGVRVRSAAAGASRNVILIVLDTVGSSHMAGYGYDRVTTPELDRLAADGIEFRNSFAAAPWTLPSHASLFTGLYPVSHAATQENLFLDDSLVTMAEIMRDGGYRTFGATNNAVIAGNSNFDQGFETYLQMSQRGRKVQKPKLGAHPTNLAALEFLDSVEEHERFFVFLNFIEAHSPYKPRREMAERFLEPEWSRRLMKWAASQGWDRHYMEGNTLSEEENEVLRSLYDAELAGLSRTIQELIDVIEERGLGPETVVVVTSDHGENIGDHGHMGHVFDLHDTLLRVPLFFYGGGLPRGVKRSDPATSVDLFHTILALAGFGEKAEAGQGRDLLAGDADEVEDLALMAEYYYPLQVLSVLDQRGRGYKTRFERLSPYLRRMRSVRIGDWKLIWGTDGHHSLYNLAEDPGESVDLSAQNPSRVRELEGVLLHRLRRLTGRDLEAVAKPYTGPTQPRGFENLDEETREQLKALGYLD